MQYDKFPAPLPVVLDGTRLRLKRRGPHAGLFNTSTPVPAISSTVWAAHAHVVIVELVRTALHYNLESVSAIQIGAPLRVFVLRVPNDIIRICVNPSITITDFDEVEVLERCGSYDTSAPTLRNRRRHVILSAKSFGGTPFFLDTSDPMFPEDVSLGLSCRIQHEMEHLDGLNVRYDPQMDLPEP